VGRANARSRSDLRVAALVRAEAWTEAGVMGWGCGGCGGCEMRDARCEMREARVGQWASHAVASARRRGRVCDSNRTPCAAARSENNNHRSIMATAKTRYGQGKTTYLCEHAICASSQVTGLGWAYVWLSRERSADRVVKRAAARPSVRLSQARVLARLLNRRNTCCGTLVRGRRCGRG